LCILYKEVSALNPRGLNDCQGKPFQTVSIMEFRDGKVQSSDENEPGKIETHVTTMNVAQAPKRQRGA
jgi:hypothetical protein